VRLAFFVARTRPKSDRTAFLARETRAGLVRLAFVRERFAFFVDRTRPKREQWSIDLGQTRISRSHVASVLATRANALDECASGGDCRRAALARCAFSD